MDVEAIYFAAEDKIPLKPQEIYTSIKLEILIKVSCEYSVTKFGFD